MSIKPIAQASPLRKALAISPTAEVIHHSELFIRRIHAIAKSIATEKLDTPNAHGLGEKNGIADPWENFLGEIGEQSVSAYFGITHEPSPEGTGPDVRSVCVRCRSQHDWDLPIRRNDIKDLHLPWVLASHVPGQFFTLLHGWGFGHELKPLGNFTNFGNGRPKAYFVNRVHLKPMSTLTRDIWDQRPF